MGVLLLTGHRPSVSTSTWRVWHGRRASPEYCSTASTKRSELHYQSSADACLLSCTCLQKYTIAYSNMVARLNMVPKLKN